MTDVDPTVDLEIRIHQPSLSITGSLASVTVSFIVTCSNPVLT